MALKPNKYELNKYEPGLIQINENEKHLDGVRKSGFFLYETDMLKSGVKPSIRRTGAELIDFLVFRNKSLKEVYGPIVAKWKLN